MRNLKRVLSLAMASVMLIGMMVVGAGAASVKDADKITHKEAADVLASINVMVGDDNGNFNPEAILTREQAAKIITYMLMGKDAADNLTAAKAPFTDVKADRWSAGSIAYCVKQGILSGMGDGTFKPEANVTGTQFAKMVLTAVGYSAKYEGLTGNGYELNVAKLVRVAELNNGLSIVLANELTRDSAAQMALNGLKAFTVEYTGGGSVSTGDTDVTLNAVRTINNGKNGNPTERFMDIYQKSLKLNTASSDSFGRPSNTWKNGVSTIGTYSVAPMVSYTAAAKESAVKSDIGDYGYATAVNVYVNNVSSSMAMTNKLLADFTGAGRKVEIYTKDNEINTIVVVDSVLGQISGINTVTNTVTITTKGSAAMVLNLKKSDDETKYNKLVELGKDAYIVLSAGTNDDGKRVLSSFTAAESVTGKYTSYSASTGKRTIGGTSYDDAYSTVKPDKSSFLDMTIGNTYVVYLDTYGNALYATAEAGTSSKNAYILDTTAIGDKVSGYTFKAKLVFEDGTQEWVTVANVGGSKVNDTDNKLPPQYSFAGYSVNAEGKYNLTKVATGSDAIWNAPGAAGVKDNGYSYNFTGGSIANNKVNFLSGATSGQTSQLNTIMGSSKTIFLMAASDGSYKVYTGIKNVPSYTNASGTILTAAGTNTASMVILNNSAISNSKDYIFVTSKNYDASADGDSVVYVYNTVTKDGTVGTTSLTASAWNTVKANGVGLYEIKKSDGSNVSTLDFIVAGSTDNSTYTTTTATGENDLIVKNDVVTIGGKTAVMGDKFTCVAVSKDDGSAVSISLDDFDFYRMADYSTITYAVALYDTTGAVSSVIIVYDLV